MDGVFIAQLLRGNIFATNLRSSGSIGEDIAYLLYSNDELACRFLQ
jgi:hypothetical protein